MHLEYFLQYRYFIDMRHNLLNRLNQPFLESYPLLDTYLIAVDKLILEFPKRCFTFIPTKVIIIQQTQC